MILRQIPLQHDCIGILPEPEAGKLLVNTLMGQKQSRQSYPRAQHFLFIILSNNVTIDTSLVKKTCEVSSDMSWHAACNVYFPQCISVLICADTCFRQQWTGGSIGSRHSVAHTRVCQATWWSVLNEYIVDICTLILSEDGYWKHCCVCTRESDLTRRTRCCFWEGILYS